MQLKFVMFPSGVGFFPEVANHDQCYVTDAAGKAEVAISAGFAWVKHVDRLSEGVCLGGRSINLALDASTADPNWMARHVQSGCVPQRKSYNMGGGAFFFPFFPIIEFGADGIGKSSNVISTTPQELVEYLKSR